MDSTHKPLITMRKCCIQEVVETGHFEQPLKILESNVNYVT